MNLNKLPKRLALFFAILGFIITAIFMMYKISISQNSTAAIGYLFLPFYSIFVGCLAAIFGYGVGYVIKRFG